MRPVHIAGVGQIPNVLLEDAHDEAELVELVASKALADAGLTHDDIGFVCSGSSDYVMGRPFSFAMAIDGAGLWPPKRESHVEMDGAWALYEAWIRLQHGDVDTALVYAYGKASSGSYDTVLTMQLDPYDVAPLMPHPIEIAALQARALIDAGKATEADFAQVVHRNLTAGVRNANCPITEVPSLEALRQAAHVASPLKAHDAPLRTDGAAAIILRVGGGGPRIAGFSHIIEAMELGLRDLTVSTSARRAGELANATGIEVAELSAPYSFQELILRESLNLGDEVVVNPSGGALAADTPFVTGLTRIIAATEAVRGGARRALGHATTGPCLQHNLVCVLEAP